VHPARIMRYDHHGMSTYLRIPAYDAEVVGTLSISAEFDEAVTHRTNILNHRWSDSLTSDFSRGGAPSTRHPHGIVVSFHDPEANTEWKECSLFTIKEKGNRRLLEAHRSSYNSRTPFGSEAS